MAKSGTPAVIGEINITPLTDIFLVLLIIMMVVTPLLDFAGLQTSAKPDSPAQSESRPDPKEKSKTITIRIDGEKIYINNAKEPAMATRAGLVAEIQPLVVDHPEGVIINITGKTDLQYMTRTMEACREAGIMKVQVAKKK